MWDLKARPLGIGLGWVGLNTHMCEMVVMSD
jgi:hypothetical protein